MSLKVFKLGINFKNGFITYSFDFPRRNNSKEVNKIIEFSNEFCEINV